MNYQNVRKPAKMARYESNPGFGTSMAEEVIPATSSSDSAINNDNIWGDDDDDSFLWNATQVAERQEGIHGTKKPSPPVPRGLPRVNSSTSCGVTPAENFALRRQRLENKDESFSRGNDNANQAKELAQEKIKSLEQEIYRLKGESSMIRRSRDEMKIEQQEESKKRIMLEADHKKKMEELTCKYNKELQSLRTKVQENNQMLLNRSFQTQPKSPVVIPNGSSSTINPPSKSKLPVIPNENSVFSELSTQRPVLLSSSAATTSKPLVVTREVQTDPEPKSEREPELRQSDPTKIGDHHEIIESDGEVENREIRVGLEDQDQIGRKVTLDELRENIYLTIERMVELKFQMISPTLERIVRAAPREIMKRLVRDCEIKTAFPSVCDYMFQWGKDKVRKKVRAGTGTDEADLPTLPAMYPRGIQYYKISRWIEVRFKNGGIWEALREVRERLQEILKSLEGEGRFLVYQFNTLSNFWRLLFWANELWRCILFEEENAEQVEKHKKLWTKELRGWSGLVLKCDWRDYFVIELEVEVRKLTLSILESIVTAGYFEQTYNRYEILCRVVKDTLRKYRFRDVRNFKRVLKIVTWSISDVQIVRYLCCRNNDGNCLARVIGENFLKVCRKERDPTAVALLYIDYIDFLEELMREKPVPYHDSKFARSVAGQEDLQEQEVQLDLECEQNDETMDCEFAATQLACPIKYKIKAPDISEDMEISEEDLDCWLDPVKYEDPYSKRGLCQCRKVLMESAVFVLHSIFLFWQTHCQEFEAGVETSVVEEIEEFNHLNLETSRLEEEFNIFSSPNQTNLEKHKERIKCLEDKKQFLSEILPKAKKTFRAASDDADWHWDNVIKHGREITKTPFPPWFLDLKRPWSVFDFAISKGIFVLNFLRTRSDNLAAAIGTEAYKDYMVLIPQFGLHMEKLKLNKMNHSILLSITPECDEDHMSNNNSDASMQSQCGSSGSEGSEPPAEIEYYTNINLLTPADYKEVKGTKSSIEDNQKSTIKERGFVRQSLDPLLESKIESGSKFVKNPRIICRKRFKIL